MQICFEHGIVFKERLIYRIEKNKNLPNKNVIRNEFQRKNGKLCTFYGFINYEIIKIVYSKECIRN